MFRFYRMNWIAFLLIIVVPIWVAQGSQDCPTVVRQALKTTSQVCEKTGRNQACYGYTHIDVTPQQGINDFHFRQPGDTTMVDRIRSLQLSPMEPSTDSWGIALMRLQADLPQSNPNNVTLLLFGDVQLQNAVSQATRMVARAEADTAVRATPSAEGDVVATLKRDELVSAFQRLAGNLWYRVQLTNSDTVGWVSADVLDVQGDAAALEETTLTQPTYQPMQAFYFQAGSDQPACAEMPRNGLLIQTPEGAAEIRLWINEVQIHMGSTVYFEAQPSSKMTVTTLEGHARVETMGVEHTAFAGSSVSVLLGEAMQPVAPPSAAFSYDASQYQNLPISLLQRPISIHPGLTANELISAAQNENVPVVSSVVDTVTTTTDPIITNPPIVEILPVTPVPPVIQPTQLPPVIEPTSAPPPDDCPGNSCHDQCPGNRCDSNGGGNPNHDGGENTDNHDNNGHGNGNGHGNDDGGKHDNQHGHGD